MWFSNCLSVSHITTYGDTVRLAMFSYTHRNLDYVRKTQNRELPYRMCEGREEFGRPLGGRHSREARVRALYRRMRIESKYRSYY